MSAGWKSATLGEVATTALGKMLDKGKDHGLKRVPYLRNVNVQWGRIDTDDLLTMELADDELKRFSVVPGDLVVCEGGEIGRAAIWRGSDSIAYQKALHRVRPNADLDATFLRYILEHYHHDGTLNRFSTGSTIAHLPQQNLRKLPIRYPELAEQRRIVEILEEHLSHLDAALASLDKAETGADAWLRGAIDRFVWDEHEKFHVETVANLLSEKMRNGFSGRASTGPDSVRSLTLTAVTRNSFTDQYTKLVDASARRIADLWLQPDDILVQRSNTPELVGTVARYVGKPNWAIFPDLLIRLRADTTKIIPEYLADVMMSERAHRALRAKAKGLAGSMPKIDQATIGSVQVPMRSFGDQRRIAAEVAESELAASRLRASLGPARVRGEALRRSLLAAAFSGRLTGTASDLDRAEEEIE